MSASTKSLFTLRDGIADEVEDDGDDEDAGREQLNKILTGENNDHESRVQTKAPVSADSPCWQFHFIMMFGCLYMAMALTAWGSKDGTTPSHSRTSSLTSFWVKITSQWITIVLYLWSVVAPHVLTNRDFT